MADEQKEQDIQRLDDALFTAALHSFARLEGQELLSEPSAEAPTLEQIAKLEKALRNTNRKICTSYRLRRFLRVALVAIITMAILFITASAFSPQFRHFWMQVFQDHTSIQRSESSQISVSSIYTPEHIPEGYEMALANIGSNQSTVSYQNAAGEELLYIQCQLDQCSANIDTEDVKLAQLTKVHGITAYYLEKNGNHLYWQEYGLFFYLRSTALGADQMVQVAESLKYKP